MRDPLQLFPKLEEMGEAEVRVQLARGTFGTDSRPLIQEWLDGKDKAQTAVSAAKRDAREEETLSIAKDALAIAKDANRIASEDLAAARLSASSAYEQARWARWAAIIAAIAALLATKDQILALIFGNP